jgi:hypothetical protein
MRWQQVLVKCILTILNLAYSIFSREQVVFDLVLVLVVLVGVGSLHMFSDMTCMVKIIAREKDHGSAGYYFF